MKNAVCDNCKHSKKDWMCSFNPDHYCSNRDSENYGYNTVNVIKCEDWEKNREEKE